MTQSHVPPADLSHIETWIFDLDNTLYPRSSNLFAQIDQRMTLFIASRLHLDPTAARALQKAYFQSHGTTLRGLMDEHAMNPHEFLEFVHDIDLAPIAPDDALKSALDRLPGRLIVYTNGSAVHAERVLDRLGIAPAFDAIHDIAAAGFRPKPDAEAYKNLVARHAVAPGSAAMFEDIARNLEVPHAMGMTTILIADAPEDLAHIDHTAGDLARFLASARIMSY